MGGSYIAEDYGDKLALLNNPDFFDQHTDSHSVGLIALNTEIESDRIVRDLLDWDSSEPHFLNDVLLGKLHYFYGKNHKQTIRYKKGMNPEIFSVIRYFIKLFQFELEMEDRDRDNLKLVIEKFSIRQTNNSYVQKWLAGNVPKLFLHSRNVEYAWNVLDSVGLRERLLRVGDIDDRGSPAWWMNKNPLRSYELGKGNGKTARELKIETVAHDTRDFFTWTVITRSRKGEANVFISRRGIAGENADHGVGFYTIRNSKIGLWKTGYSISFHLDPEARAGSDFIDYGGIILVLNKSAIKVIPDSLVVGDIPSYLHLLQEKREGSQGMLDKARIQLDHKYLSPSDISDEELREIAKLVRKGKNPAVSAGWLSLDISSHYPNIFLAIFNQGTDYLLRNILSYESWLDSRFDLIKTVIDKTNNGLALKNIARYVLSRPGWEVHSELLKKLLLRADWGVLDSVVTHVLPKDHWGHQPDLIQTVLDKVRELRSDRGNDENPGVILRKLIKMVLSKPGWERYPSLAERLLREGDQGILALVVQNMLEKDHGEAWPDLVELAIERAEGNYEINAVEENATLSGSVLDDIITLVLSRPGWEKYPYLVEKSLAKANQRQLYHAIQYVLKEERWRQHSSLTERVMERARSAYVLRELKTSLLPPPEWKKYPHLVEKILMKGAQEVLPFMVEEILVENHWRDRPDLIEIVIERALLAYNDNGYSYGEILDDLIKLVLSQPGWEKYPYLIDKLLLKVERHQQSYAGQPERRWEDLGHKSILRNLARFVLSGPGWEEHSYLVGKLLLEKDQGVLGYVVKYVLAKDHWGLRADFVETAIARAEGDYTTKEWSFRDVLDDLIEFVLPRSGWDEYPHLVEKLLAKASQHQLYRVIEHILAKEPWKHNSSLIENIAERASESYILEQLEKRVLTPAGWEKYPHLVKKLLMEGNSGVLAFVVKHILVGSYWRDRPDLIEIVIERALLAYNNNGYSYAGILDDLIKLVLSQPGWEKYPYLVDKLLLKVERHQQSYTGQQERRWEDLGHKSILRNLARFVLSGPGWEEHSHLVGKLLLEKDQGVLGYVVKYVLAKDHWGLRADFVETAIARAAGGYTTKEWSFSDVLDDLIQFVFPRSGWDEYPHLVEKLLAKASQHQLYLVIEHILAKEPWKHNSSLIENIAERADEGYILEQLEKRVLTPAGWEKYPHLVQKLLMEGNPGVLAFVVTHILVNDHWMDRPDFIEVLIERYEGNFKRKILAEKPVVKNLIELVLSRPGWEKYPYLVEKLSMRANQYQLSRIVKHILTKEYWGHRPDLIEAVIARAEGGYDSGDWWERSVLDDLVKLILSQPGWEKYPFLMEKILEKGHENASKYIIQHIISKPSWVANAALVKGLIENDDYVDWVQEYIIAQDYWRDHPQLADVLVVRGGQSLVWPLAKKMIPDNEWANYPQLVIKLVEKGDEGVLLRLSGQVFATSLWRHRPDLLEIIIERGSYAVLESVARSVLSQNDWAHYPHLVEKLVVAKRKYGLRGIMQSFRLQRVIKREVLSKPHWANNLRLLEITGGAVSWRALVRSLRGVPGC